MKNPFHLLQILILLLIVTILSCNKDEAIVIAGTWDIKFVITTDINDFPAYNGEIILVQDDDDQITGSIELHDQSGFYAYAELLPRAIRQWSNKIRFETYVWLVNDSVSTLTLTYSGTIYSPSDHMGGTFYSGESKIGNWSADKR